MSDEALSDEALLAEQAAYYRAGAAAYDRPYAEQAALQELLTVVDDLPITGDVLELACGTGQWTPRLAARARSVTAVDASAEVLDIARARVASAGGAPGAPGVPGASGARGAPGVPAAVPPGPSSPVPPGASAPVPPPASAAVHFLQADLFRWQPPRRYDTVFFAFWLSHVPPARLPDFWRRVAGALVPGGRAVFVDDGPAVAADEELLTDQPAPAALRRLDDGSRYRVVKVFHDARTLTGELTALGWSARIRTTAGHFVGVAEPPSSASG
ncbi:class I SAM-dependent methyltransferase [Streptomyces sp. NPDC093085]|uniref:class I SAM-dependent methyltransferase n=1 Tax=Streptomyces sp. NPDC093085 TaxID=3155068 RepID=UPI003448563D